MRTRTALLFAAALVLFGSLLFSPRSVSADDCVSSMDFGQVTQCAIGLPGEEDAFTFDATAGDRIILRMAITGEITFQTEFNVFRPDDTWICQGLAYIPGPYAEAGCELDVSGTYTILASDYGDNETGNYSLFVQRLNNPGNATSIAFDQTVEGTIDDPPEMNAYTFNAESGDRILIRMFDTAGTFQTEFRVFRPDGTYFCQGLAYIPGPFAASVCELDASGTYTILAGDYGGNETGNFSLFLSRLNNVGDPTSITFGQTVTGTIDNPPEMKVHTFNAESGDRILLRMADTGGNTFQTEFNVYRPNGAWICQGLAYIPGSYAEAVCVLDMPGVYTILAGDYGGNETGNYNLFVQRLNNPGNPTVASFDQTITRTIDFPVQMDAFTFHMDSGDRIVARMLATDASSFESEIRLFRPDGTEICRSYSYFRGPFAEVDCATDGSGTHTILVGDYDGNGTGEYRFYIDRLNNPGNPTAIAFGQTLGGTIETPPEMNIYTFYGAAGDRILVRLLFTGDGFYDVRVPIRRPDGTELCRSYSYLPTSLGEVECLLDASGIHSVLVGDYDSTEPAPYSLFVQKLNNPGSSRAISFDQTLASTIDTQPEMDAFTFDAVSGDNVTVRVLYTGDTTFQPVIRIYRPGGTQLCNAKWNIFTETACDIDVSGRCSVLVGDEESNDVGSYVINIHRNTTMPNLWIGKTGAGSGTITSSPSGIECGSTCTASFISGTPLTLTVTESPGSIFTGWNGACYGYGPCSITMDANKSVFANFIVDTNAPEIDISGNAISLACGDATPSLTDHTDFGDILGVGGKVTRTFTIRNSGNDVLLLNGTPKVAVTGINATEFSIVQSPAGSVAVGGSTIFKITFSPGVPGTRTAALSIANNDADENPCTFAVQGDYFPPVSAAPGLVSPPSAAITNDTTPTLVWTGVLFASTYQIQIDNSSTFSSVNVQYTDVGALSKTVDELPNGKWYWRVRGVNLIGRAGPWASYRSFTIDTLPPAVPRLYAPANNAFTTDTTPSLTVYSTSGAKRYRFQVSDSADFTAPLVDQSTTSTTFTIPAGLKLAYHAGYHWRAKAIDAATNESDWSAPRTFTVTFQNSPRYGAFTTDTTPTFTWAAVAGAKAYKLIIEREDHTLEYEKQLGLVTSHTIPAIYALPYGKYMWQMQVNTTAAGWLESPWRPLTITPTPLAAPALLSPASGTRTNDTAPEFTWSLVAGAVKYELWLDNSTSFSSREFEAVFDDPQSAHTLLSGLPDGTYYWRMRTINYLDVPGLWSAYRSLTIDTLPLSPPALSSPSNLASVRGTPTFSWLGVSGAKYYQFRITLSSDPGFAAPVYVSADTLTSTSHKPPLLDPAVYLWQARVRDLAGNWSAWRAARTVTIRPLIPAAPALISPVSSAVLPDDTPDFSWNSVPYGQRYQIQISASSTLASPLQDVLLDAGLTAYTASPLPAGTYYWRVRAVNVNAENGAWSVIRKFTLTP